MHLIALLCQDDQLGKVFSGFRDANNQVYLHSIPYIHDLERVMQSLEPLDFAGMLVLSPELQERTFQLANRSSLDAQEAEAADSITVAPGTLVAEFNLGRAVGRALAHSGWDAKGARAAILGDGAMARAIARELASLGVSHLSVLGKNRPLAEKTAHQLAITTDTMARAHDDPYAYKLLDSADVLVRIDPTMLVPARYLGPHLTVVDLSSETMSHLRQQATNLGANTLGIKDVQAQQIALCLNHILGASFDPSLFLKLLHEAKTRA